VARFDTWVKRFRTLGEQKPRERVLTYTKYENLTVTQAWRFKQLQRFRIGRREKPRFAVKPHYPLPEACTQLGTTVSDMLRLAASKDLECFVLSAGLRGHWCVPGQGDVGDPAATVELPPYLALTAADCGEIQLNGSANVTELERPSSSVPPNERSARHSRFRLGEPLWVNPERIVLRHPLPTSPGS
jgi:hypothetical protein